MPNDVTVAVSTADFVFTDVPGDVPDRLDVGWKSPTDDAATQLFQTTDGGGRSRMHARKHATTQTKKSASCAWPA